MIQEFKLQGESGRPTKFLLTHKQRHIKGAKPGETGKEDPDTKVDIAKMSYEELTAYMTENPDAEV